jgi:hypothetical protein
MNTLEKSLRNRLERAVREARDIAEEAARAAIEQLGVGESAPYNHLTDELRDLRRRLRIHGRQLGDFRHPKSGKQHIDRLTEEVAYEHWHRMLFAKFLAENNLLMYPDPDQPVAVTLEECEDLAQDEGARNGWELAARFAARMLPQIFRPDSPVFELTLPPEHQLKLERLLSEVPAEVFTASDSLGWVYQFWQAKKKDDVDASGVKIGARELPVVTQLFTEPYMVAFLLDNSIGAWWAARRLMLNELDNDLSEEDLRQRIALPWVPLKYLRFIKDDDGNWAPAAGTFDKWPDSLDQLKVLDPCCGSGHFLVAALLMLVPMRMKLESLSVQEAVDAVLEQNLYGLEIDQRCVELAAFALALNAWRYPGTAGYRHLPDLNLACSGLSIGVSKEEWTSLASGDNNVRLALDWLYDELKDAPLLGSLLNPEKGNAVKIVEWEKLESRLRESVDQRNDDERQERGVVAHGLTKAARLLAGKYNLVITNVPYLFRGKHSEPLKKFLDRHYKEAKHDLATVFLDRCLEFCPPGGTTCIVIPQNWLFLTSYKKFRERLLRAETWHLIGKLGFAAFDIMDWWAFNTTLVSISRGRDSSAEYSLDIESRNSGLLISGIDASESRECAKKAELLKTAPILQVDQDEQLKNPDSRIVLEHGGISELLSKYAFSYQGVSPADFPRFGRQFWESVERTGWCYWQSTVVKTIPHGGRDRVLWLEEVKIKAELEGTAYIRGQQSWGKKGVAISAMGQLSCTLSTGEPSDTNAALVVPQDPAHLPALWCFCSSPEYNEAVRRIDQTLKVTNATLVKVPFDLEEWKKVAVPKYPSGLPRPYSDDPTQWIFHGHPAKSEHPLQVAVARLLGYRWPAELDSEMELSEEAHDWVGKCEDLKSYADKDCIVCIPPVGGETSAADRLHNLLAAAYGGQWTAAKLSELLAEVDHAGKSLESWLRDKFFIQHCKLFHDRPFIWQIWDGLRDGFSVLVNYHRLDKRSLERLVYTYLGDWIRRQKNDADSGVEGSEERLDAAENLKKKLELILEGEAPYDIFVRWKAIEKQPIGWEPDLNDGVRLNIRPFMSVPDVGKKGAGVLRDKPNIKWNKDRGKDVESAPWYHFFQGDRINDHHLTLAEKRAAREAKK